MEEKYKAINRELVLKNQILKQTINSLTAEITHLKEEQFETNQNTRKLLNEVEKLEEKHEIFKKKIISYTSGISQYLTKMLELVYPKQNSNDAISETSISNNTQVCLSSRNNRSNRNVSVSKGVRRSAVNNDKEFTPPSYINIRRKRSLPSTSSSALSIIRKSNDFDQIISSPRRSNIQKHSNLEKENIEENSQDSLEKDETLNRLSSSSMTTIVEEGEETAFSKPNSIIKHFSTNSKTSSHFTQESIPLKESTIPNVSVIQPICIETAINNDITISNVPCSTPFRKKDSLNNANNDEFCISLKMPRILLKKLTPKKLKKFGVNTDMKEINNDICKTEKDEKQEDEQAAASIKEKTEENKINKNNRKRKIKEENDNSSIIGENSSESTKRVMRTRKISKNFAEPSLRMKLRR